MTVPESTRVLQERIRTLEDALRPFVEAHAFDYCLACRSGNCKYETARRALEGEG